MVTTDNQSLVMLENGDRLDREEFEHRYACSKIKKAELIEGIVQVASPLRFTVHGKPHSQIVTWLGFYQSMHPGLELGIEPTVRLDEGNEVQPDVVLFRREGRARIDQEGYIAGAPELIAEIAASSVSYDLHSKKRVYERHGVKEYIVWRTLDRAIDWFIIENDKYISLIPDRGGIFKSKEFSGLHLDLEAMLLQDMSVVLQTLTIGATKIN